MNERECRQLDEVVNKISNLSKLSDEQNLLLELHYKIEKTGDDERVLLLLLKAERTREKHDRAVQEMQNALENDKSRKKKLETRKKIIIGGAMLSAMKKDTRFKNAFSVLCSEFMNEQDRELFLKKPVASPKISIEIARGTVQNSVSPL